MPQEDAYTKVQRILDKDRRLALLIEEEPRFLQLLHVAASQYKETVITGRWNSYEALKKTYKEILKSSKKKELSSEEYEVLISGLDELLPVASVREILQLEFAEPRYDEIGEEY